MFQDSEYHFREPECSTEAVGGAREVEIVSDDTLTISGSAQIKVSSLPVLTSVQTRSP